MYYQAAGFPQRVSWRLAQDGYSVSEYLLHECMNAFSLSHCFGQFLCMFCPGSFLFFLSLSFWSFFWSAFPPEGGQRRQKR